MKFSQQETFDRVVAHLRSMPHRAMSLSSSGCAYRSADGLKCAVGYLIPDELYDPIIEQFSVERFAIDPEPRLRAIADELKQYSIVLLRHLQDLHDDPRNWGPEGIHDSAIAELAECFNFKFESPKQ